MKQWNRILIVDDEKSSVRLLERVLRNRYLLKSVTCGEEAVRVIPSFRPDLILMDINMPGMDGYEACRRIRADEHHGFIKILLISGHASLEERLKGYEVGADDYVPKPFDNNELKAKVDVFMKLKRVEEIDTIKGNLLSLFAHETKTPLSGIIGISELMILDEALPATTLKQLELIHRSAVDLHHFVEKASLLSNLKSGMRLQCIWGSVEQHLHRIAAKKREAAAQKNINVKIECPNKIEIFADWDTLDEVLGYILDNAVKYSDKGSEVRTRAEVSDNICTIEIADKGKGIDPGWIDNVFNEFSIQDLMHHKQGQGLSLAIAKQVVEMHSGEIKVSSTLGSGAVFTVRLPILETQPCA